MVVFFKQKTAYGTRISDWSSDVCPSDLAMIPGAAGAVRGGREVRLNAVRAPFSASEDFEPMKAYGRGQAFQEARQKAASEAHPTAANVAAGAGIVGGLTLTATKIAKGATLFQKAKAGMKKIGRAHG